MQMILLTDKKLNSVCMETVQVERFCPWWFELNGWIGERFNIAADCIANSADDADLSCLELGERSYLESHVQLDDFSNPGNGVEDDEGDSYGLSDSLNAEDSKEAEEVAILLPRDTPKVMRE